MSRSAAEDTGKTEAGERLPTPRPVRRRSPDPGHSAATPSPTGQDTPVPARLQ